ncbi:MAG TPA: RraA family protein [Pirellulales bacterium]|nr:RraA family protein [Pirellulales bacterium]
MIERHVLEQLASFDTALLANTIGYIDDTPAAELYVSAAIKCVTPSLPPSVGIAFTCELDSSTPGNVADVDRYWEQMEEMSKCSLPIVWVVKAVGSRPEHECVLGDGMAKTLHSVGCGALVSDGYVRDVQGLLQVPFAAYCRGRAIHHCALRFTAVNRPVEIGGLMIRPGDVIHANEEGVIRIPQSCLLSLNEGATRMRAFEQEAHRMLVRTDLSLSQKRDAVQDLIAEYGFADCVAGKTTRSNS